MTAFGPAAVDIMWRALEDAWQGMSENERRQAMRSDLAARVIAAAEEGERDPTKLAQAALAKQNARGHDAEV